VVLRLVNHNKPQGVLLAADARFSGGLYIITLVLSLLTLHTINSAMRLSGIQCDARTLTVSVTALLAIVEIALAGSICSVRIRSAELLVRIPMNADCTIS
jgi:hypothetical protein